MMVSITVGRNRIEYPGKVTTNTADLTIFKIYINSVISTWGARYARWGIGNYYLQTPMGHRWELTVIRHHSIRGNYHCPFLGVIFSVILHDFIRQNYHKNQSDRYPFFLIMINYKIFPINYHILYFQIYFQYLSFLQRHLNNVS